MSKSRKNPPPVPGAESQPEHRAWCAFLARYFAEWGAEITRPSRANVPPGEATETHLVLVVAFAAAASAVSPLARDPGTGEFAAPLLGLRALDFLAVAGANRGVRTNAVLVEGDPGKVEKLLATLRAAGFGDRVRRTNALHELAPGEIGILGKEFCAAAPQLLRYTEGPCYALYLLAPRIADDLPLDVIRSIGRQERTDALVRFPVHGFRKYAQCRGTPLADLPTYARRVVEGYSALFGDARHEWTFLWRDAERTGGWAAATKRMAEYYRTRLAEVDPHLAVKQTSFAPPGIAAEPIDLFLLTADPARALRMNRVLRAARIQGEIAWGEPGSSRVREEETGVLDLFGATEAGTPGESTSPARVRQVDWPALAHEIASEFAGQAVPFGTVLRHFVETNLFGEEIRRAMSMLRQAGRVSYLSLGPDAEVSFRSANAPPAPLRGGSPRRERGDDLSLPMQS